jgi:hypothetical protein
MQLRIAALADYTNITQNGKLNILGIFSQIQASQIPAVHPQMQLVLQFSFEVLETGSKSIKVILQDVDGRSILTVDGVINLPTHLGPDPIILNQVMQMQNVAFPNFGSYEFAIELDGQTLPIRVPVDVIPASSSDPRPG